MHQGVSSVAMAAGAVVLLSGTAVGAIVEVSWNGEVEFNQIGSGPFAAVSSGDAVNYSFQVDSDVFVDGSFPTRGYEIIHDSFSASFGPVTVGLQDPYAGVPYFVLRNDDPAVDGFFLGSNPDGFPNGVATDVNGGFGAFRANASVTYGNDPLPSLDIVDAAGTYDFTGLTVFGMSLDDGPFQAMGLIFSDLTITVIPAPGTAAVALLPALCAARRRR